VAADLQLENAERLKRALGITTKRVADQSNHAAKCSWVLIARPIRRLVLLPCIALDCAFSCADGVKTIWLGFRCLANIAAAYQLMLGNPPSTYG
jgi:hypothetical protein